MFFSFPSHKPPARSLHPTTVYSSKLCRQHFLLRNNFMSIHLTRIRSVGAVFTFIPQEGWGCIRGTKQKPVMMVFVVIIWINCRGYQVQRRSVIMGKWCLWALYLRLGKRPTACLAFCWYETTPVAFRCQNTEEVLHYRLQHLQADQPYTHPPPLFSLLMPLLPPTLAPFITLPVTLHDLLPLPHYGCLASGYFYLKNSPLICVSSLLKMVPVRNYLHFLMNIIHPPHCSHCFPSAQTRLLSEWQKQAISRGLSFLLPPVRLRFCGSSL